MRLAGFVSAVLGVTLAVLPAAADTAFELLQDKKFEKALSALEDSLRRATAAGDQQQWRLAMLVTRLAHKDEQVQQAGFAEARAINDPAALVRVDWASGVQLWALELLARDPLPGPGSRDLAELEAACRGPGPMGETAGSALCGVALAFEAAGDHAAARRMFAAAIARCGPDSAAAMASAACALDLTLFADTPWGTTPLDRTQTTAVQAIVRAQAGSFASAVARFAAEEDDRNQNRIALPKQYRTGRMSLEMSAFPKLRDTYFMVFGKQTVVCLPKGRFVLLPGCSVEDGSRLGPLLLPFEKKGESGASDPTERVRQAGDLLARAMLMRRGLHVGGSTIEKSGVGPSLKEKILLGVWDHIPPGLLPAVDNAKELWGSNPVDELEKLDIRIPASPESLLVSNPWVYGFLGKELTRVIDRTLGEEVYANPRIPYLDWGAREAQFGIGLAPGGLNSTRAWEVSEFWRAANIKKYAALNAIARNDHSLSETERALIRSQMTLWWEQIVADYRQHVSEDYLDSMTGEPPPAVLAQIDTVIAREAELNSIRGRVQQISDNRELREKRRPFVASSIAQARECQPRELPGLLPPGTLFVTISTAERSTAVVATLITDPVADPDFVGQLNYGFGRQQLVDQLDPLLAALAKTDSPEEELIERGSRLFDALFSDPRLLDRFDRCERIIFAPNGPAGDIPFPVLVRRHGGQPAYLGLEHPISVTESAALLRFLLSTTRDSTGSAEGSRVIAGDPSAHPFVDPFTRLDVLSRPQLPEARKEAADIGKIYDVPALTDTSASEAALRARAAQAGLIHVATHGYTPTDPRIRAPLAAGVWVARTCDSGYDCDGMLQAWELVTQMNLQSDLVVFSGCSTGRMWTQFGTVGELARSTLYSGARSVVVAQWNVSDASTRALMTAFHRRLKSGTPRDRALQEAMAELRGSAATKHPTNWASFRCLGVGWR